MECSVLVRLDQKGQIQGDIHSCFIIIEGELNGDIQEAEQVEIRKSGQFNGNITTKSLAMA
ncbi:MAG: bactofilin family protein [Acidobacteriota bacterium]